MSSWSFASSSLIMWRRSPPCPARHAGGQPFGWRGGPASTSPPTAATPSRIPASPVALRGGTTCLASNGSGTPGTDGLAAAAALTQEVPTCRSLILTTFGVRGTYAGLWNRERTGLSSRTPPLSSSQTLSAGSPWVLAAATIAHGVSPLTSREHDVLVVARPGASVAEIADRLLLSEGTVRNYLSAAMAKVGGRTGPRRSGAPTRTDGSEQAQGERAPLQIAFRVRSSSATGARFGTDSVARESGFSYFQRKWTKTRPKLWESFSTRWYWALISF